MTAGCTSGTMVICPKRQKLVRGHGGFLRYLRYLWYGGYYTIMKSKFTALFIFICALATSSVRSSNTNPGAISFLGYKAQGLANHTKFFAIPCLIVAACNCYRAAQLHFRPEGTELDSPDNLMLCGKGILLLAMLKGYINSHDTVKDRLPALKVAGAQIQKGNFFAAGGEAGQWILNSKHLVVPVWFSYQVFSKLYELYHSCPHKDCKPCQDRNPKPEKDSTGWALWRTIEWLTAAAAI